MNHFTLFPIRRTQRGATLIEVLVSMFILALGVMALLAMQVRTSAGVKEAENMSIVSQATQNLVENMITNPVLSLDSTETPPVTRKNYDAYLGECPDNAASAAVVAASGAGLTRDSVVTDQKNRFCAAIQTIQGVDKITATAASDTITVEWTMRTDGTASGVTYSYSQTMDD